jgi:hypothetical protein
VMASLTMILRCSVEAEGFSLCLPVEWNSCDATELVRGQGCGLASSEDGLGDVRSEPG